MTIRRKVVLASLVLVSATGCQFTFTGCRKPPIIQTCTCIYPLAPQCESACHLTEYVVQSTGPNQVIGRAVDQNNKQAAEEHVIPTSKLSATQLHELKPGTRIQVISKMVDGKSVITSLHVVGEPAAK